MVRLLRCEMLASVFLVCAFGSALATESLYVSPAGKDSNPCTSQLAPCASLQAAIEKSVAAQPAPWTIEIAAGHYGLEGAVVVPPRAGPPGVIHGAYDSTEASGVRVGEGSPGNWAVTYMVRDAANIADGDHAIIRNVAGSGAYKVLEGNWRVVGHTGRSITVRHTGQFGSFPAAALSAADVTVIHSVLNFANSDGIDAHSSFTMDGVGLNGGRTGAGILTAHQSKSMDEHVAVGLSMNTSVIGFETGLNAQYGNTIDASTAKPGSRAVAGAAVSDAATYGALAQHGGSLFFDGGIANGNQNAGIGATNNGDVSGAGSNESANAKFGTWTYTGGSFLGGNSWQWANGQDGDRASFGGLSRLGTHSSGSVQYNAVGLSATGGGVIYAEADRIVDNATNNLQATDAGIIYAVGANASGAGAHDVSVAHRGFVDINAGTARKFFAMSGGRINVAAVSGATTFSPALDEPREDGTLIYDNAALAAPTIGGGAVGTGSAIVGNDYAGRITVGSAPTGATFTIKFAHPKSHAPACVAVDESDRTKNPIYPSGTSTTSETFVTAATPVQGNTISYSCHAF